MPAHEHTQSQGPAPEPGPDCRTVTLVRGAHRWRFVCPPGDLTHMAGTLTRLALDPTVPLDRIDAAIVRQQLDQTLAEQAEPHSLIPGSPKISPAHTPIAGTRRTLRSE